MQNKLLTILIATACLVGPAVVAANYSTEATMSLQPNEGTVNVDVRVLRLVDQEGKLLEDLVSAPRIKTAPGVPGTLYTGLKPADPAYASKENVTVDVSWPYPNESGVALCAVVIKRGDNVVSKSRFQLKVEGPGRTPLIVKAQDVDPKSVRIVEEKSNIFLFLELTGKTKEEVKKLANENYGNKVHVRDLQGRMIEGGLSFGTYKEIEMTVQYGSKDEAEHVASILRGDAPK